MVKSGLRTLRSIFFSGGPLLALVVGALILRAPLPAEEPATLDRVFTRLYNFDFPGAQAILERHISEDPDDPLGYSTRAAAYLFSELDRLKILETDFFLNDDKVVERRKLKADPALRAGIFSSVEEARRRANILLSAHPEDRDALFALCMASGVVMDYAALVERRRFGSFPLAKQTQAYVNRLVALDPPVYDAYLSAGSVEYVVGSLPWIFRWLVHIDQIQGSKQKAIENLQRVSERGRYYKPFARVLLAVIYLREKQPARAEQLLAGLADEFPENPLIRRELHRVRERLRRERARRP